MCGIIGFTGRREAAPILLEGLRRLEYRGYDSSGIATGTGRQLHIRKKAGRLTELQKLIARYPAAGCYGIGHTRWATHGGATDRNAHPHTDQAGLIAVVHNGVIENHAALRQQLQDQGIPFRSETDTEVLAHLIAHYYQGDLVTAVQQALQLVRGTYGLAVVSCQEPGVIVAARWGSPLVVGSGPDGRYLASDVNALGGWVEKVHYLEDGQLCVLTNQEWEVLDQRLVSVPLALQELPGDLNDGQADKGDYPHFMLKEIYEQPEAIINAMRGRLHETDATAHFGGLNLTAAQLRQIERIIITGCGTSYYAGLVGEYLIEELARLPVEVEYASELRYRHPPMDRNTILLAITQSGETADTLAAVREANRRGQTTLAICNVVGSSIAREAQGGVYLHAGPEIGVASTKAFTAQCLVLTLLALHLGRLRHLSAIQGQKILEDIKALPHAVRATLKCHDRVKTVAEKYAHVTNMLYLGRQYLYPVALEGALKLKEISYIHAEGYPAAEMKHGPIALVDEQTPSVFLVPTGPVFDKVLANMQEIKARGGPIIAIASGNEPEVTALADDVIVVPSVPEYLQPMVTVIPLQLLAYEIALLRGCDVDRPRNLAKSVTVE
jgi:glucosamine--fructose-6-phosphate aminotransferase (isomerizing)